MFTQTQIKKEYDYDSNLGELVRIDGQKRKAPESRRSKYNNVTIDGKAIQEHRAIWIWHHGEIPEDLVLDHIDCNTHNNRIENLRLSTKAQNGYNQGVRRDSKTGLKGVRVRKDGRYQAFIIEHGQDISLGIFNDPKDAARAYDIAALKIAGEYARTNKQLGLI